AGRRPGARQSRSGGSSSAGSGPVNRRRFCTGGGFTDDRGARPGAGGAGVGGVKRRVSSSMTSLHHWIGYLLTDPKYVVFADFVLVVLYVAALNRKLLWLVLKSLRRNLLRTILTAGAIVVLVFVITLVWTVLWFLDRVMTEKAQDFKAIAT